MAIRRGSWDSFPRYIRWERPPSAYVQAEPAPESPPSPEPVVAASRIVPLPARQRAGDQADAGQVSPTGPGEKTDPCPSPMASRPTDSTRRSDSPASGSPTNGAGARPSAQPAEVLFRLVGRLLKDLFR